MLFLVILISNVQLYIMIFHTLTKLHCTFIQTHQENHLISEFMIRSSFVCREIGHLRINLVNCKENCQKIVNLTIRYCQ